MNEGLSQSQVYSMCEDKRGYLWMATRGGGACRFDGKTFVSFTEENGLINNYVRCIYEDKSGNLWFGTDEGLSKYDGEKFTNYSEQQGIPGRIINVIAEDGKGNILLGTEEGGMAFFDGIKYIAYSKKEGLSDNKVHCFYTDKTKKLWIGTENGASCFDGKQFINYTTHNGLPGNIIYGITEDNAGNLWFTTYGGGVSCFDGKKFNNYTVKDGLCNNTVFCIINSQDGNLWFGTAIGASRFNCRDHTFKTFTDKEGLCGNVIMCMLKDSSGNIWLGSSGGGISRFDSERFIHFNEESGKIGAWVYAVMQDSDGAMWFGSSNGGVTKYDGKVYINYSEKQGFTKAKIKCIYESGNHTMWFGTVGEGIYYYDGKTFKRLSKKDGLCANYVNAITSDKQGNIWIVTSSGGICCYDPAAKKFLSYEYTGSLGSDRIFSLCFDNENNLWAATQYAGVSKIIFDNKDSHHATIIKYKDADIDKTTVRSILISDEKLFFGTAGKGIVILDGKNSFVIGKKDGISSDNIYSLIADNSGNLWTGTEKGIDKIEFDSKNKIKRVKHYGKAEGFTGVETSQNAVCKDANGNLWFGTIDGVTKYNPAEDHAYSISPKTHITGIRLFFEKIEQTEYGDSNAKWYPVPQKLQLPYDKNNLSFDFVGVSLRNPEKVYYKWKMDDYDNDWSPKTELQTATYSNLLPGNYIFRIKSCNEDGIWNSNEQTFEFTILAPFWQTWWFRSLIFVIALSLIAGVFSWRVKYIKRQNKIERNHLELQKNIAELEQKALRLQMNPHFIFNALNSIQGFISGNEPAEAKRHLAKFSKLMRQILESSRKQFISIKEETTILCNYLDLEKLSSGSKFSYSVAVDENIDAEKIAIPPMIIQPFVENAVQHGIRQKEDGRITIKFSLQEKFIACEITDNGTGIKESLRKKEMDSTQHQSAGIEVTEERLKLLTGKTNYSPVEFIDLSDKDINGTGTTVHIRLPFEMA